MLNTIISDISPEIYTKGLLHVRWYNLFFATGVLGAFPILAYMFQKMGKDNESIDELRNKVVLGVLLGARLGHVIFYEWTYYKDHLLEIFLPVRFEPSFKITGYSGLASHGAFIGIILAIILYIRQFTISFSPFRLFFKNPWSFSKFLWIADHSAIVAAFGSAMIRIGNFANSEIIGKPTADKYGVVFVRDFHDYLCEAYKDKIQSLVIRKPTTADKLIHKLPSKANYQPLALVLSFKESIKNEASVKYFLEKYLKTDLIRASHFDTPHLYELHGFPLLYTLEKENNAYQATVYTCGVPRHPAQLYESFSYFLIFIVLFLWWRKKGQTLSPGRIFGTYMVMAFLVRFFYEFFKENQVSFEDTMYFNMGQWLSVPGILAGLFFILRPVSSRSAKDKEIYIQ